MESNISGGRRGMGFDIVVQRITVRLPGVAVSL